MGRSPRSPPARSEPLPGMTKARTVGHISTGQPNNFSEETDFVDEMVVVTKVPDDGVRGVTRMVGDVDGAQHTTSHVKGDEVLNVEAEAMTSSGKKHELMNVGLNKEDIRAILSPMLRRVKSTNNE